MRELCVCVFVCLLHVSLYILYMSIYMNAFVHVSVSAVIVISGLSECYGRERLW